MSYVCYVEYSSQPYVQFFCDEDWGYVRVAQDPVGDGVYQASLPGEMEIRLYTFDNDPCKVTCEACLAKLFSTSAEP